MRVTTNAASPTKSSDVGRFNPDAIVVNVPSASAATSDPVFGSAGAPGFPPPNAP